jgi:Protein of unknown function (DUF1444)
MWVWASLAWVAIALLAAWWHRRWRRVVPQPSAQVAAFMLRFENELSIAHPEVEFRGLLPDRFACLLGVDGQETAVSLHELYRHADAPADAFTRTIKSLLGDIREVGLDRVGDLDFAAAAPLLMPQIRSRSWLEQRGAFGDSGLVHTPLASDLVTVYVLDQANDMVFVCREHLRRWRKEVADLHHLAVANLARRSAPIPEVASGEGMLLQSQDGYDAARILLLDRRDGLLVAIPDRDSLWVGRDDGQSLEQLMATTEAMAGRSSHPVSGGVYRVTDGQLQAVSESR